MFTEVGNMTRLSSLLREGLLLSVRPRPRPCKVCQSCPSGFPSLLRPRGSLLSHLLLVRVSGDSEPHQVRTENKQEDFILIQVNQVVWGNVTFMHMYVCVCM